MQLTPRYDEPALLRWEMPWGDPSVPLLRQRARLAGVLADLDAEQWSAPSRCEGWSVQDVIAHLVGTNQFWAISIAAGRQGAPTRYLETFDPVATPSQMVDAVRSWSAGETLERFIDTNAAIADALIEVDPSGWSTVAEGPPGHLPLGGVVLHALWDAWIHERDIALPLAMAPIEEPDEVAGCLAYAAVLGPAFLATAGSTRRGAIEVEVTEPDVRFVVELGATVVLHDGPTPAGALRLTGDAVELVEALSFRRSFDHDVGDADRWMLGGLAEVFDVVA